MTAVLSREQMRAFDRLIIQEYGVSGLVLMENAGRNAAQIVMAAMQESGARAVCIVCGGGNNGGDGFVVARHLSTAGVRVSTIGLVPIERLAGDARCNAEAWVALGGTLEPSPGIAAAPRIAAACERPTVLVDAVFGTGLDREVGGDFRSAIEAMNRADAPRVSLDIPSGLDANTGRVLGCAVQATATVTFGHPKLGLLTSTGWAHAGALHIVDLGVPTALWARVGKSAEWVTASAVSALIPRRPVGEHKVSAGRVAVIAGSPGKVGAALLAARGALRAGAGLVTIASHPEAVPALEGRLEEAMTWRIDPKAVEDSLDALMGAQDSVLVGPGLGRDQRASTIVNHVALNWRGTATLDADAVSHFQERPERLREAAGPRILTPHSGELARLLSVSSQDIEQDRFAAVARAVDLTAATVLLKGPCTIIGTPGLAPQVVTTGHEALATGGTGDVLGGIVAAFAAKLPPLEAATVGTWLHGQAARAWTRAAADADRGMLAHEVADNLPGAIAAVTRRRSPVPV